MGDEPPGRRAELRGDRGDEGHRGGEGRARQVREDVRDTPTSRAPTTGSTTRSTTRAWRPASIDDFVVVGTEDAFKRTADTRDGDKLADADRYKNAIDDLEEDRLGHYYVDAKPLIDAAMKQDPEAAQNFEQFKSILPLDKLGPITGAFTADGDGMALDTVVTGLPEGPIRNLAALWSGGERPDGRAARRRLGRVRDAEARRGGAKSLFSTFAGAIGGAAVAAQFKQATGLDLQQDVFSWIGDAGVFVRGADMATLDGALVISSTDDARAEAAFTKIVGLVAKQTGGAPAPAKVDGADAAFAIAVTAAPRSRWSSRAVRVASSLAYGEEAASAAFAPDAKLADSDGFEAAAGILGDDIEPAFLLSVADVDQRSRTRWARPTPSSTRRGPYLEALGVVTSGGKVDGDRVQSRVAVTLK